MRMKWFNENVLDFLRKKPCKILDKIHQNRPQCVVIQNVISVISEKRSLRSCYFLHTRCGAVSQDQRNLIKLYKTNSIRLH